MNPMDRRHFLGTAAGIAASPFLGALPRVFGEDKPAPAPIERKNLITDKQLAATRKGLAYLAKVQSPRGAIGGNFAVATTSLAGCAFLAEGHLPGRGKYGEVIKKTIEYLLECSAATRRGYITEKNGGQSRMHGHGFATMYLAEAYGMMMGSAEISAKMRDAIAKAVARIEASQTNLGGWGYEDQPTYDEGSVTVAEVMALRSARNAGFKVEKKVIEKGLKYLEKSSNPDGSFKYSLQNGGGGGGTFPLTAGAVASLQLFGNYEAKEVKKGLEFMKKNKGQGLQQRNWGHFFYGAFYATMAHYFAGGTAWEEWFPPMRDEFIKSQQSDGSWNGEYDNAYGASWAVLTLAIPYQYLPIFQI
jgi:hypothetical protein